MINLSTINWTEFLARIIAFLTAIPIHEAAHAYISDKQGDPTPKKMGRITLNPIKSLDPFGLISMLLIGYGWAKPVQIDARYYKNPKKGMALTAAAGPLSNFIMAYIAMVLAKVLQYSYYLAVWPAQNFPTWLSVIVQILQYLVLINVVLGVFNLLPIPPFDGSRIFLSFLPDSLYFKVQKYEKYTMIITLVLLYFTSIGGVLSNVYGWVFNGFDWATGYIDLIFTQLIRTFKM